MRKETRKKLALFTLLVFAVGVVSISCVTAQVKPTESNFIAPKVTLDSIQVSYWEGFWHYGKAKVEKGKAPKFGGSSPVTLDFVFEITNPNQFPVKLDIFLVDLIGIVSFDSCDSQLCHLSSHVDPFWNLGLPDKALMESSSSGCEIPNTDRNVKVEFLFQVGQHCIWGYGLVLIT